MKKKIENYFIKIINGTNKSILSCFFRFFLRILSYFFQIIVSVRNFAFDKKLLRQYYPPVPVIISVGNIVAGGAGKTPATLLLAKQFYETFHLAILSRGYKSPAEHLPVPIMLSKGNGPMHPASYCGDEPYLLSQNLPKAFVFVGKDRHKSSDMAVRVGSQVIFLDDGMQHRRLARDFEVVVIDSKDPFGMGFFLPRGFLREGVKSLSRANLIILNHINDNAQFETLKKTITRYSKAPIIGTKMKVVQLKDLAGNNLESIASKKVGLFCGIAHPQYFLQTVEDLKAEVVDSYYLSDHSAFDYFSLDAFAKQCKSKGAEYLVCTEKDRVKINTTINCSLPIIWIQSQLEVVEGQEEWEQFLDKVRSDLLLRI
ncbi:Tetraacyldisaccharide 4'-kinase [Candidatus Rubidus massiliensis]|nr:Tetraacyldisaccharide 4'-kinase [Candidatus Rubidus massiliensis]